MIWYGTGRGSDRVIRTGYPLATASGSVSALNLTTNRGQASDLAILDERAPKLPSAYSNERHANRKIGGLTPSLHLSISHLYAASDR
jgi:hypothetical protein